MDGKLFCEIVQREEGAAGIKAVGRIETFLVFPVAALYFAVMPRRVRPDKLVPDSKFSRRCFK